MIFILINENHKKHPEKLVCSSFKVALRKSVPLYTSESVFKTKTDEMCQCFFKKNHKETINSEIINTCSKDIIFDWIMPSEKFANKSSEQCFKNHVYNKIVLPFIIQELNITFSRGVFRNDILNYSKKENHEKNKIYQYLFEQCNNSNLSLRK